MMARLLLVAFVLAACGNTARSQRAETTFHSPACKVTFAHPGDWEVVRDTSEGADSCRFTVRSRDWQQLLVANDSVDVHSIFVQIFARGVWAQVEESPFRRRDDGWVVLGRQDLDAPADSIGRDGWTGVRGTAPQGCYRLEGGYAGLCEQPTALVGTSDRSVLIIAGPQANDTFDRMLATLQFL